MAAVGKGRERRERRRRVGKKDSVQRLFLKNSEMLSYTSDKERERERETVCVCVCVRRERSESGKWRRIKEKLRNLKSSNFQPFIQFISSARTASNISSSNYVQTLRWKNSQTRSD